MRNKIVITNKKLREIVREEINNYLTEGINVDANRKVELTDEHELLVNTSTVNNPTCTKDIIPTIEVWSIFQRKSEGINDGNPLLYGLKGERGYTLKNPKFVYSRIEKICEKFINEHDNMQATLVIPSTNSLNTFLANTIKQKNNKTMIIDNLLVKMTIEEVDDFIFNKDSAFRKKYGIHYEQAHNIFMNYCSKMNDGIFRLHLIEDMEMRKVIDKTIKLSNRFYGAYMSAINGKDILIIDDSITTGQSIKEAYKIIAECYEPKSITILTLMSPLYNEDGNDLKDINKNNSAN